MQSDFTAQQAKFFDTTAKQTGVLSLKEIKSEIGNEFEALIALMPDIKNKSILDLGCGTGRLSLMLAMQKAKEVVGIDISKDSIAIANKSAKKYGIKNFYGIVNDFNNIEYKNRFDYVVCLNLIHHTTDLDSPFQKIKKSLKSNGKFFIFEFNPFNPLFPIFLWKIKQFKVHANKEYLRSNIFIMSKILEKSGFSVKVYRHALLPTSLYKVSPVFKNMNTTLNRIPIINLMSAYNIFVCSPKK